MTLCLRRVLENPVHEPLRIASFGDRWKWRRLLRLAVGPALSRLHKRGLIPKDIKPRKILVNSARSGSWAVVSLRPSARGPVEVFGPSAAVAKLGMPGTTLDSKIKSLRISTRRFKTA